MKRIIREVITLVRIERWLVRDEMPLTQDDTDTTQIEHSSEELIVDGEDASTDSLRVIAQRILESQQWEISEGELSENGAFLTKRFHNDLQTPKEGE